MRGCFVTGTGTGVGKTVLSAAIAAALAARGVRVGAFKPVVTGTDERQDAWPQDHELLAAITGQSPAEVAPARFGPPMSPHLAAELDGTELEPAALLAAARRAGASHEALIVEGVGGLLVPLGPHHSVRDFALGLGLPLVVAASPGLGTINHTLLTLEAARAVGLEIAAVVLTPWPHRPSEIERSNRDTIARLGEIEVAVLAPIAAPDRELLAGAGAALDAGRWLGEAGPASSDRAGN